VANNLKIGGDHLATYKSTCIFYVARSLSLSHCLLTLISFRCLSCSFPFPRSGRVISLSASSPVTCRPSRALSPVAHSPQSLCIFRCSLSPSFHLARRPLPALVARSGRLLPSAAITTSHWYVLRTSGSFSPVAPYHWPLPITTRSF